MLPKNPCARKLQEAYAAQNDRVREDCEKQMLPRATVCKTVKSEGCQGRLCAMR